MSQANEPDVVSAGSSQDKRPLDDSDTVVPPKKSYKTQRTSKSSSYDLLDARLKKAGKNRSR